MKHMSTHIVMKSTQGRTAVRPYMTKHMSTRIASDLLLIAEC
jgi:hypothetical protein